MANGKRSRGRPATFDRDVALDTATALFLRYGYEGTSIAMLTEAMGVTAPTLYNAFGSKERCYAEVLARYQRLQIDHTAELYAAPTTTLAFVETLLRSSAALFAGSDRPTGCLIAIGSLRCGPDDEVIVDATRQARATLLARLTARIAQARIDGDLPPDCDTTGLARFVTAVVQGLAIQAMDGAGLDELNRLIDVALRSWPGSCRD